MEPVVIVGLGNPGGEYERTRHNVGFRCVDRLASRHGARFSTTACRSRLAQFAMEGRDIVLAKPRTFMNLSGQAAQGLVHRYRIPPEALIVVYDDVDLPLGKLRIRPSGRAGGHNGMKSIITALNTESFVRLRLGVGRPEREMDDTLIDHVLGGFSAAEEKVVQEAVERACDALERLIADGVDAAMNEFN